MNGHVNLKGNSMTDTKVAGTDPAMIPTYVFNDVAGLSRARALTVQGIEDAVAHGEMCPMASGMQIRDVFVSFVEEGVASKPISALGVLMGKELDTLQPDDKLVRRAYIGRKGSKIAAVEAVLAKIGNPTWVNGRFDQHLKSTVLFFTDDWGLGEYRQLGKTPTGENLNLSDPDEAEHHGDDIEMMSDLWRQLNLYPLGLGSGSLLNPALWYDTTESLQKTWGGFYHRCISRGIGTLVHLRKTQVLEDAVTVATPIWGESVKILFIQEEDETIFFKEEYAETLRIRLIDGSTVGLEGGFKLDSLHTKAMCAVLPNEKFEQLYGTKCQVAASLGGVSKGTLDHTDAAKDILDAPVVELAQSFMTDRVCLSVKALRRQMSPHLRYVIVQGHVEKMLAIAQSGGSNIIKALLDTPSDGVSKRAAALSLIPLSMVMGEESTIRKVFGALMKGLDSPHIYVGGIGGRTLSFAKVPNDVLWAASAKVGEEYIMHGTPVSGRDVLIAIMPIPEEYGGYLDGFIIGNHETLGLIGRDGDGENIYLIPRECDIFRETFDLSKELDCESPAQSRLACADAKALVVRVMAGIRKRRRPKAGTEMETLYAHVQWVLSDGSVGMAQNICDTFWTALPEGLRTGANDRALFSATVQVAISAKKSPRPGWDTSKEGLCNIAYALVCEMKGEKPDRRVKAVDMYKVYALNNELIDADDFADVVAAHNGSVTRQKKWALRDVRRHGAKISGYLLQAYIRKVGEQSEAQLTFANDGSVSGLTGCSSALGRRVRRYVTIAKNYFRDGRLHGYDVYRYLLKATTMDSGLDPIMLGYALLCGTKYPENNLRGVLLFWDKFGKVAVAEDFVARIMKEHKDSPPPEPPKGRSKRRVAEEAAIEAEEFGHKDVPYPGMQTYESMGELDARADMPEYSLAFGYDPEMDN